MRNGEICTLEELDDFFWENSAKKSTILCGTVEGNSLGTYETKRVFKEGGYLVKEPFTSLLCVMAYNTSKAKRRVILYKLKEYFSNDQNKDTMFRYNSCLTWKERKIIQKHGYNITKLNRQLYYIKENPYKANSILPASALDFLISYKAMKQEQQLLRSNYKYFLSAIEQNINPNMKIELDKSIEMFDDTKSKLTKRGFSIAETTTNYYIEW